MLHLPSLQRSALALFYPATIVIVALQGTLGLQLGGSALYVGAIVQAAFVLLLWRASDAALRSTFVAALLINLLGEVVCLNILGLYSYAGYGSIGLPAYVVLGHGMLVWWSTVAVLHLPARWHRTLTAALVALASLAMLLALALAGDAQSLLLFALLPAALLLARSPAARLLVVLNFWVGLSIELTGTTLGAWEWAQSFGHLFTLGAGATNPPLGAGGLYAMAEAVILLVVPLVDRGVGRRTRAQHRAASRREAAPARRSARRG